MEQDDIIDDVFDIDDIDSPIDPISEPVRVGRPAQAPQGRTNAAAQEAAPAQAAAPTRQSAPRIQPQRQAARQAAQPAAQPQPQAVKAAPRQATDRQQIQREPIEPLDTSVDWSFFTDGRASKLGGVILIFLALFLTIAAISFFSAGAADQSAIGIEGAEVDNAAGPLGAIVANAFIAKWLGIGSFVIIFLICALGLALMRSKRFNLVGLTVKSLISAIALSIVGGYVSLHLQSHFSLGGTHGLYINSAVKGLAGEAGALIVALLFVAVLVIVFLKELTSGVMAAITYYKVLRMKVAHENERRRTSAAAAASAAPSAPQPSPRPAAPAPAAAAQPRPTASEREATATEPAVQAPTPRPISDDELRDPIVVDDSKLRQRTTPAPATPQRPRPVEEFTLDDSLDSVTPSATDETTVTPHVPAAAASAPAAPLSQAPAADRTPASAPQQRAEAPTPQLDDLASADDESDTDEIQPAAPAAKAEPQSAEVTELAPEIEEARNISRDAYDPTAELSYYRFPSLDTLNERPPKSHNIDIDEQEENKARIRATLNSFGISISHIKATIGPTVTLYEIVPAEGVRISRIKTLEDDIARSIAAVGTRIIAPIPGKETVGIEVPNKDPQIVPIRTILSSEAFQNCKMQLPMAMGATISNEVYIADLTKMPHLLVAGATGMGKSVGLNTIIASLLFKKHPAELKFVLVDPKMVEFSLYKKLERHYLAKLPDEEEPIITDTSKVVPTLNSLCVEMDNRYNLLKMAYVRSITEYNSKFTARQLNPADGHRYLPYIVVIVDEFADLIMTAGREVEQPIARIAQKARAVGIHLILATQRPSTNVITGIIKANFPGRIAFRVFQMVDSRTILDRPGANQLIGRGDMLFSRDGVIDRVQCALIETKEVEALCDAIASQQGYPTAYELPEPIDENAEGSGRGGSLNEADPLFADAARYVITANQASTTSLQRRYEIGYPRAGKIMDQLERAGVVGPAQGSKPRSVLLDTLSLERLLENMGLN